MHTMGQKTRAQKGKNVVPDPDSNHEQDENLFTSNNDKSRYTKSMMPFMSASRKWQLP
ncbi:hypothetical protein TanjilG_00179 [Lupinus angustifolius]|uniref:Uncharacterized protein n=1 Tax=Lupinus angustifolius TaxID=3871 RepID=A0A394D0G1_LUPAN|nr:hypothetical protein TanjilG_00179 [Lupinus angustifolius]